MLIELEKIKNAINGMVQLATSTYTYTAFNYVINEIVPNLSQNSTKVMFTLTDSEARDKDMRDPEIIDFAHKHIEVQVAVGVGADFEGEVKSSLNDFCSNDALLFEARGYDNLPGAKKVIISSINDYMQHHKLSGH